MPPGRGDIFAEVLALNRRISRYLVRFLGIGAAIFLFAVNYSEHMMQIRALPETLYLTEEDGRFSGLFTQQGATAVDVQQAERLSDVTEAEQTYTFRLFGVAPLRSVRVVHTEQQYLVPGGTAVGITLHTRGVLVVGLGSVRTATGVVSPGSAAGLQPGDVIVRVAGQEVRDSAHLAELCGGHSDPVELIVERAGAELSVTVHPACEADSGEYRLGLWARDSTAGVGTLSFYDESAGWFAALGHAVSDVDTQSTLTVREGKLVSAEIVDVARGEAGEPGELLGTFSTSGTPLGNIVLNTEFGIYGTMNAAYGSELSGAVPLAYAYEAHEGPATILSTVSGHTVGAYDCRIVRVNVQQGPETKSMVVEVTDPELLSRTGGIVQGMSGSPILQDGKLIGVVTHVFVNDPAKGYCIYAEWMYRQIAERAS